MIKAVKFGFYTGAMVSFSNIATKAKESGKDQRALFFLRKALEMGRKAVEIRGINEQQRADVLFHIFKPIRVLYQEELIAWIPEDDRKFIVEAMDSWSEMGLKARDIDPVDQLVNIFDIVKSRLGDNKEIQIYGSSNCAIVSLRNIIRPFLAGEATKEETERRLEECVVKLRKWLPELLRFE